MSVAVAPTLVVGRLVIGTAGIGTVAANASLGTASTVTAWFHLRAGIRVIGVRGHDGDVSGCESRIACVAIIKPNLGDEVRGRSQFVGNRRADELLSSIPDLEMGIMEAPMVVKVMGMTQTGHSLTGQQGEDDIFEPHGWKVRAQGGSEWGL